MFLKAFEYCWECDVDICLMICLKHNGQVVFFKLDSDWSFLEEQLVGIILSLRDSSGNNPSLVGDTLSEA